MTLQDLEKSGAPLFLRRQLFPGAFRDNPPPTALREERALEIQAGDLRKARPRVLAALASARAKAKARKRAAARNRTKSSASVGDYLSEVYRAAQLVPSKPITEIGTEWANRFVVGYNADTGQRLGSFPDVAALKRSALKCQARSIRIVHKKSDSLGNSYEMAVEEIVL